MVKKLENDPRHAAYLSLLSAYREEKYLSDSLQQWSSTVRPDRRDLGLAREIASGTMRRTRTLDAYAQQLSKTGKLSLKLKEKVLLRMSLYQVLYMERVPVYAVANEMVQLARETCHQRFASFLNAILQKIDKQPFVSPKGSDVTSLGIRYSYPDTFVSALIEEQGQQRAVEVLEAMNLPPETLVRLRTKKIPAELGEYLEPFGDEMAKLTDPTGLEQVASHAACYLQNSTPVELMRGLSQQTDKPSRILDLCAAPGGKTLLAHDLFPSAQLFANDVSHQRLERLQENLQKYSLDATVSCSDGTKLHCDQPMDLIIIDAPCSNSGVLNRRAEARWRQTPEQIRQLRDIQLPLIAHAKTLLSAQGQIWYLTCSILQAENLGVVNEASETLGLKVKGEPQLILPDQEGRDGGFACALAPL